MKKILLIALLLTTPFIGFSQTTTKPITGFLGIKFGSTKLAVIAALKTKGAILDKKNSDADNLVFSHVKLGLREADFIVRFVNNKAFEADYIFTPDVEAKVIPLYDDLVADVTKVYGTPGQVTKTYNSPYAEGDGNTLLGLSAGKIDFNTGWFDEKENSVAVSITTDMVVQLQYQDKILTDQAIAHQDAKQKGDF